MTAALQPTELETQLTALQTEATGAIAAATTLEELEKLRVGYLGKKGEVSKILGGMGKLDPSDRPRLGSAANEVKTAIQTALDEKRTALQAAQLQADRKSTRLNSSHIQKSRMPSSA